MTEATRTELESCARLLGRDRYIYQSMTTESLNMLVAATSDDLLALARAAMLCIDWDECAVMLPSECHVAKTFYGWPADGTESACIIKAAAAVQIEREKQQ